MRQRHSLLLSEGAVLIVEVQNRDHEEPGWMYSIHCRIDPRWNLRRERRQRKRSQWHDGVILA